MKKLTILALVLALIATFGVTPASAQSPFSALDALLKGEYAGRNIAADNTNRAIMIWYAGGTAGGTAGVSGTVTVAAGGAITFLSGAIGAEAADDSLECPVVGALGGVIDVTNAACDTMGEVVDIINNSTGNRWRAFLLDSMRTDSSNNTLLAGGPYNATGARGTPLFWETAGTTYQTSLALVPDEMLEMPYYLVGRTNTLKTDPFVGTRTGLFDAAGTATFGVLATDTWQLYSIKSTNVGNNGFETATLLYSQLGGATTVENVISWPYGVWAKKGEKFLLRLFTPANAQSVVTINAAATQIKY